MSRRQRRQPTYHYQSLAYHLYIRWTIMVPKLNLGVWQQENAPATEINKKSSVFLPCIISGEIRKSRQNKRTIAVKLSLQKNETEIVFFFKLLCRMIPERQGYTAEYKQKPVVQQKRKQGRQSAGKVMASAFLYVKGISTQKTRREQ